MPTSEELIAASGQAGADFAAFVESLSRAAFHHRAAPEEWTVAEIAGHVSESPARWAEQLRQAAVTPGSPLGGQLDDAARLAAVSRFADSDPTAAAAAVRDTFRRVVATLSEIPPSGWESKGNHARFGEFTVADAVQRFIVGHTRGHVDQARTAAGSAPTS